MGLFESITGTVEVKLISADIPGAMAAINRAGMMLSDIQLEGDIAIRFRLKRTDYKKLTALVNRRGEQLEMQSRKGLYWSLKSLKGRAILVLGMGLLLAAALYLPGRIFFVEVEGNTSVPARQIVEAASDCGIGFGASRREVRSEKMKNALLAAMPELSWAGVNTRGCVAVITVRERAAEEKPEEFMGVSSIVAACDGVVLSCDVVRGNGLCTVGQAVRQGQVLISGYTDCGICITATQAEGEIFAQTRHELTAVTPSECLFRQSKGEETVKYSLIVGKKRINFYKGSGISEGTCVKMYSEYHLTLPGGFQLPVTLVKEVSTAFDTAPEKAMNAESALSAFAVRYLCRSMIAGSIVERMESVISADGVYCLTGDYVCTEMIGRVRTEQNGEYNETD